MKTAKTAKFTKNRQICNCVIMLIMATVHSGKPDYPGLEGSPVQVMKIAKITKTAKFTKNHKICNCVQSWT